MFRRLAPLALLAVTVAACGSTPAEEVVPTTSPVLTTAPLNLTTTTTEPIVQRQIYTVQPGDTLGVIAVGFGTTVEAIKRENGLEDDVLTIGQPLVIPPSTTTTEPTATEGG